MSKDTYIHVRADDPASQALATADPELGAVIDRIGEIKRGPLKTGFPVIARSIVGQQLSEKVAPVIWQRVVDNVGLSPEALANASFDELRAAGLSGRKVEYVQGVAQATLDGEIDWDALDTLDDEQIVEQLTMLRGVGRWTVEMYLIFALNRPDVLALDDYGVRASAGRITGLGRPMTKAELAERGELWRPYRSTASLYLWADHG